MAIEIKSPTFPESVADGTVANWVKKEGDQVNQDEIIAEIETDKVVLEVVAPTNGVLTKILKKEGDIVNSAEIIGEFDDSQQAQPQNKEKTEAKEEVVLEKQDSPKATNKKSGPAAKKIIAENNIDPQSIESSRKDQRITKADVINHLESKNKSIENEDTKSPILSSSRPEKKSPYDKAKKYYCKKTCYSSARNCNAYYFQRS